MKRVIFMSAKSIWNDNIPIAKQKGNRLFDIFVVKVTFSSFYFVFPIRVFLLKFDLF